MGSSFGRLGVHHDPNVVRAPVVKPQGDHVTIPLVVKEHVEARALGAINSLTQTLIHCTRPLVEGEPFAHHGNMCTSCGSLCTFGNHVGDGADDGIIID